MHGFTVRYPAILLTHTIFWPNLYITKVLQTADFKSALRFAVKGKHACLKVLASQQCSKQPAIKEKPRLCCRCSQQRRASLSQRARVESERHLAKARMMSMRSPLQSLCWHLLMTMLHKAAMVI